MIYKEKVVIRGALGINTLIIPIHKIASVKKGFMGIRFETTGGGKTETVQPYDGEKKDEAVNLLLDLISQK